MRLIDADKLKQHYAWWNDENKELFDAIVDIQPTIEPESAGYIEQPYVARQDMRKEDEGKCQK